MSGHADIRAYVTRPYDGKQFNIRNSLKCMALNGVKFSKYVSM